MSEFRRGRHVLRLPGFELDCRDWLIASPGDGTVPEELGGVPVLAVLSTVIVSIDQFDTATAVLSLALADETVPAVVGGHRNASPAVPLPDAGDFGRVTRYAIPAPGGALAVLAELNTSATDPDELIDRFRRLMASFRWAD